MTKDEVIKIIDYNIGMCRFNPMTGEEEPMNKDCEDLANALEYLKKENEFLQQWKDDIVNSLSKFDANSIEEVYQYGINRGNNNLAKEVYKILNGYLGNNDMAIRKICELLNKE